MKLVPYPIKGLPVIELSQESADKLVELYYAMINVHKKRIMFDQEKCNLCVIGNGIRAGILEASSGFTRSNFDNAINTGNFRIGLFVDEFSDGAYESFVTVPEPATLALLALGALIVRRRRP